MKARITTIRTTTDAVKSAKRILKRTQQDGWSAWHEAGLETDNVPLRPTLGNIVELALEVVEKRLK